MVYLIVSPSTIFAFVRGVWMTRLHSTLHVQQLSYIPGSQSGKSKDSEVVGAVQKKQLQHGVRKIVLRPLRRRAHAQVNCSLSEHDTRRFEVFSCKTPKRRQPIHVNLSPPYRLVSCVFIK